MCSTFYKGSLLLEAIPFTLAKIKDIGFPDILHLYFQSIRGFGELFDRVGYFEV
jgi:hypothetical protein